MHCWIENSLSCELESRSVVKDKAVIIHKKTIYLCCKGKTREKIKLYGQEHVHQQINLKI